MAHDARTPPNIPEASRIDAIPPMPSLAPPAELRPFLRSLTGPGLVLEAPSSVVATARSSVADLRALPLPGKGDTRVRHAFLSEVGAVDLSLARIVEGHVDATAILAQAGRTPTPDALYGVWAADVPGATIHANRTSRGWTLHGTRRFASGGARLDRALVTAHADDGLRLFDVAVDGPHLTAKAGTWEAVGMANTDSVDVVLDGLAVTEDAAIGGPGFYLERPGFWYGAIGVAACWYGGALACLRMLVARLRSGPANEHQRAHLGAVAATCASMQYQLVVGADAIDADRGVSGALQLRALVVRQLVEAGCQEVLTRTGRAGGTSPLVFDRAHARRAADLVVYLRQHHAERDLVALGDGILAEAR